MKGNQGVVGLARGFKEWCPHEVVRNLPIEKNIPVPGSGGTSGEPERMLGHLEAEGMSSEILGREAEEGRRPRQGDKRREARPRAGEPAVWPGEQLLLRAALPLLRENGLSSTQGPDCGLC